MVSSLSPQGIYMYLVRVFNWGNDLHLGVNLQLVLLFIIDFFFLIQQICLGHLAEILQAPVLPSDPCLRVLLSM